MFFDRVVVGVLKGTTDERRAKQDTSQREGPVRIGRAFELMAFLRYYQRSMPLPVVLDQGLAQKLWSLLIESEQFSDQALEDAISDLAPFAPDLLVWVEVAPDVAAARIAMRQGGNSRFDNDPAARTRARLEPLCQLYSNIIEQMAHLPGVRRIDLDGSLAPADNARRIAALCRDT